MKETNNYKPIRNTQEIAKNIIVLDGFSSSGKSMVGSISGWLERSEYWQINDTYERLSILNFLGEISDDSASALLKLEVDNHLYNLFIGRDVNYRKTDLSSPFYDGRESTYLERISKKDGDSVIDNLQLICKSCNTRKGPLDEDEFKYLMQWVEHLKDETKEYVLRKLAKGGRY